MNDVVDRFQSVYQRLTVDSLELLDGLYAPEVEFTDPVHTLRGLPELRAYCRELYDGVAECRFDYPEVIESDGRAAVAWVMHLRHTRFRPKETLSLAGVSLIQFGERVTRQHDYFDLGAMIYERVPVLGLPVRALRRRLARVAA